MPNVEKIIEMNAEGFSNKEIAEELGTEEEPLTYQAVAKIVKASKPEVVKAVVANVGTMTTRTAEEYEEYSLSQGRTSMGGEIGVKVDATIEDLRAKITSGWKPSMFLEKWQMNEEELKQLTWALAKSELRDRQPTINYKQDFFRF
jgi:hypothetical protein